MTDVSDAPPPKEMARQSIVDRALIVVNTFAYASVLLALIIFGGSAIVEIVGRTSVVAYLRTEIISVQARLAQERGSEHAAPMPVRNSAPSGESGKESAVILESSRDADIREAARELRRARGLLNQMVLLSSVGSTDDCLTMVSIAQIKGMGGSRCQPGSARSGLIPLPGDLYLDPSLGINTWSDEALFLVLAICSGAMGALIAGLRTVQFTLFRDLALGFASGFIVYLGMKGGKHVFLLSTVEGPTLLNPYAYAFAGILVGLFTERAYRLLASLVDEIEGRLRGAVSAEEAKKGPAGAAAEAGASRP